MDSAKIRTLIEFASTAYKYTVLDLPRSDAAVLDTLDTLNAIVVVVNQELATVKSAGRLASTLRQRYGREKVQVVLSRSDRQADIGTCRRGAGDRRRDRLHVSERLSDGAAGTEQGPSAGVRQPQRSVGLAQAKFAYQLAGIKAGRRRTRTGFLGRLTHETAILILEDMNC